MSKFPHNEIISLLDENLRFNLAESTAQDLMIRDILAAEVLERLKHLRLGYGSSQGGSELRSALGTQLEISPENVLLTNGAAAAIFLTVFAVCQTGDEVVTVTPNFPPTLDIIAALGARKREVRLAFDEKYRLTAEMLAGCLSDKTKLVMLTTPHNPSGVAMPIDEIQKSLAVIEEQSPEAWLLIDETYREATYGVETRLKSAASLSNRIITTASFSKCHGSPGLRVGWLTCQSPELMKQLVLAKMNTVISCSVVDEFLALEVFRSRQTILEARQCFLRETLELTSAWAEENAEFVEWTRPAAGALCCVRLRKSVFNDDLLNEFISQSRVHQLQLAFGSWFGDEARVFRLGFGYLPITEFKSALIALSGLLKSIAAQRFSARVR